MSKKTTSIRKAKKQASLEAKKLTSKQNTEKNRQEKELTLHEAYEILGGYTHTFSKAKYAKALEMVMAVDPEFAKVLDALNTSGKSFKTANSEEIATAEEVARNAEYVYDAFGNVKLFNEVTDDPEIQEAFDNTPLTDSLTDKEYHETVFMTAQNEVIPEIVEDKEFANAEPEKKKNMLVSRLRTALKKTLFRARLSSLPKGTKSFREAFNFKNKVRISAKAIANLYERSYNRVNTFITDLVKDRKNKAAVWLNKTKTRTHNTMVKLAAASIVLSSLLPSCKQENANTTAGQTPVVRKTVILNDTTKTSASIVSDTIPSDTIQTVKQVANVELATDSLSIPTEWNDSIGVSKGAWTVNQTFFGDRAGYENAYNKITDGMLEKSGFENRDQFLNAYRVLRSYYPNVIENQGDTLASRSETSEKFSKFFNNDDCIQADEFTNEDFEILQQAPQLTGTLNRRSTQELRGDEPCDPGKVQFNEVSSRTKKSAKVTEEEESAPILEFEELGQSTVVSDSIPQFDGFDEFGSNRVITTVQTDTLDVNVKILKGNTLEDGIHIDSATAGEIATGTVSGKKDILAEATSVGQAQSFSGFDERGASTIVSDSISTTSTTAFSFEETGTSTVVSDSIATPTTFSFTELGSSSEVVDSIAASDSVQIVSDTEDLPLGTPAAGNVTERGGYENTGLISKRQYTNLQNWYIDNYGDNAFEFAVSKITDEMLAKGGAFEGLSREEALRVAEALIVHQNQFPESAAALKDFLNPCKDATLSAEDAEQIRKDGYNITEEGLVTGGVYKRGVWARYYVTGDCDKEGHIVYERGHSSRTTTASNQYYGRLYKKVTNTRPEPITYSFEEAGVSRIETQFVATPQNPVVHKLKGNNLNISESIYLGEISADGVSEATATNRTDILVEEHNVLTTPQPQTFSFVEESGQSTIVEEGTGKEVAPKTVDKKKKAKKSKKQIEQEALEMARQDYLRMQNSH